MLATHTAYSFEPKDLASSDADSKALSAQADPSPATRILAGVFMPARSTSWYFSCVNVVHCTAIIHDISFEQVTSAMYQEYADKKAAEAAETDIVVLDESVSIADAVKAMREKGVSSVLVSRTVDMQPVGIVTERDILYRVIAEHRGPFKTTLKEIMSSPLVTIDGSELVKDAVVLMRKNAIRRMPVTKEGKVVGMLTLKLITGDSHEKRIELIDVELPTAISKIVCPYCQSKFENKQDLSKHIDRLHLESGLLEGDLRRW